MKWLSNMAVAAFAGLLISAAHAQVLGVKTVYVLPMAGGLDQYLALQLTSEGVLRVVTDPQKADAILTDGIGARLEENLTELFGAPVANDKPEKDKPEKDQSGKAGTDDFAHPAMQPLSHSRQVCSAPNQGRKSTISDRPSMLRASTPACDLQGQDGTRHTAETKLKQRGP